MTTLVMLSGGVESCMAAWRAAQAGPVLLVHLRLAFDANARRAEARAARAAAAWIGARTPEVEYLELAHPVPREVRVVSGDMDHLAWPRAALLAARPDIDRLARCAVAEDVATGWHARFERYRGAVEAALAGFREPDWDWIDPLGWPPPPKAEVAAAMPPALRALSVSCRFPLRDGTSCERCTKCAGDGPVGLRRGWRLAPQPVLRPRRWDWDRILLAGHDPLGGEPPPGRTLVLAPHPEPEELEAVRAAASDRAGARVLVEPIWLPGLRQAVSDDAWSAARMAAGRVVADLWRATTSAGADAA